ncbi:MAG: CpaD family pilus assembly lipoprotein [Rickettsiales bacterium]
MQSIFSARNFALAIVLLLTAACGKAPADSAYFNRGGPESLLDVSSEVVNLSASNRGELKELAAWVEKDRPTRAEINCTSGDKRCDEVQKILDLQGVPTVSGTGTDLSVTLVYERILARDCNQRFVNNTPNPYNTPHPAFGCSVAANMVQQVSDKQEFISPNLSDDPSARRAVNDYNRAYQPRPVVAPYSVTESVVDSSKSQ